MPHHCYSSTTEKAWTPLSINRRHTHSLRATTASIGQHRVPHEGRVDGVLLRPTHARRLTPLAVVSSPPTLQGATLRRTAAAPGPLVTQHM